MRLVKNFKDGIVAYPEAVQLVISRGLWYYYLFPVVLQVAIILAGDVVYNNLVKMDFGKLPAEGAEYYILFIGLKCIFYFATAKLLNYLVLALLSPALTRLSYQTEYLLTGNTYSSTWKEYWDDIKRAYGVIFRNMFLQMGWIVGWYIVTLPFPSAHSSRWVFVFIIGAYFYGFSLLDYTNERLKLNVSDSVKFVRKHFVLAWTLGAIYYLLFIIPYAGVVLAPVTAVVASTIAMDKTIDLSKNPHANHSSPPPVEQLPTTQN